MESDKTLLKALKTIIKHCQDRVGVCWESVDSESCFYSSNNPCILLEETEPQYMDIDSLRKAESED